MGQTPLLKATTVVTIVAMFGSSPLGQKAQRSTGNKMTSAQIDALWTIDDPVAGYKALSEALAKHPDSADEVHTQIARSLGLQGKFKEGRDELDRVGPCPSPIVVVRKQLEIGRLKNSSGDPKSAEPCFRKALQLASKGRFDYYAVDAAHMLAIVTSGQESLDWNNRALAMAAKSKDARARNWRGSLLNNIGWTYHDMGRFTDALQKFEEAVAFRESQGEPRRTRIARYAVARCLRSLKRYDDALAILNDLIQFPEAGFVSEELGENLLALGKPDEAKPHFRRAYELLSQDEELKKQDAKRLERLRTLGL